MPKYLHISSLPLSLCSIYACQLSQQSMLGHWALAPYLLSASLYALSMLASYLTSLCQAIRLSSISLYLLLAISLVYVRPSGLAPYLPQLHLSLVSLQSLSSLSIVSSKGIATVREDFRKKKHDICCHWPNFFHLLPSLTHFGHKNCGQCEYKF